MSKPLSSHTRDGAERVDQMLAATTYNRVSVFYWQLRGGHGKNALRCINNTPRRYQLYFLNEHGAYCNDREIDSVDAKELIRSVTNSDGFVGYERGAAEKLWPGAPHYNKPTWSGGDGDG